MENHPRISLLSPSLSQTRIILGSFPTWTLTDVDPEKNETRLEKELVRIANGDIPYFYGSSINRFWIWYKTYIDPSIKIDDIGSIEKSLRLNSIGITDMILSCTRKGRSSLDKHLTKCRFNYTFFDYPKSDEKIKILCTSKGVMNEMLLSNRFFKTHPMLSLNHVESSFRQDQILDSVEGNPQNIKAPIFKQIDAESGGIIECMSTPSPGSPYRRLIDFGLDKHDKNEFLKRYLENVFEWFIT